MMRTKTVKPIMNNARGYTLIEILIAMVILSVGILGVTQLQLSFMQSNAKSSIITTGSAQTQTKIEELLALDYDDDFLDDDDGDGTGHDLDGDGIDDDGEAKNFGLDHIGAAADEGPINSDRYTFFWNVAVDHPANETKTINVIVQWPDEKNVVRTVNYTFIKAKM